MGAGTYQSVVVNSKGVITAGAGLTAGLIPALPATQITSGTIDGATIATSDITVGSGKTVNVCAGTLTLADNQINKKKRKPRAPAPGNSERAIKFWHNFDKLFKMPNGEGNEPSDRGVEKPLYDLRAGYLSPSKDNNHIMFCV